MPTSHSNGPPTYTFRHPASWASLNGSDTLLGSPWISGPNDEYSKLGAWGKIQIRGPQKWRHKNSITILPMPSRKIGYEILEKNWFWYKTWNISNQWQTQKVIMKDLLVTRQLIEKNLIEMTLNRNDIWSNNEIKNLQLWIYPNFVNFLSQKHSTFNLPRFCWFFVPKS